MLIKINKIFVKWEKFGGWRGGSKTKEKECFELLAANNKFWK